MDRKSFPSNSHAFFAQKNSFCRITFNNVEKEVLISIKSMNVDKISRQIITRYYHEHPEKYCLKYLKLSINFFDIH